MQQDEDFSDVQKLLRLKRYETPGPDYIDNFLKDFHQRQRSELIKTPLWRIAADRVQAFFSGFQVPKLAYAGAFAAVALSVVGAVSQLQSNNSAPQTLADAKSPVAKTDERLVALSTEAPRIQLPMEEQFEPALLPASGTQYVLPTRPVSFAPSNSF